MKTNKDPQYYQFTCENLRQIWTYIEINKYRNKKNT